MKRTLTALICSFTLSAMSGSCGAEDFGISQKTFDSERLHTVFMFRNGVLIHEITEFLNQETGKREHWVERFYAENQLIFIRTGSAHLSSERYTGISKVSVAQGSRDGKSYPERLSVGKESFNMGEDGFYHVIADPQSIMRESVLFGVETSTRALDEERKKHLGQLKSPE